MYTTQRHPWIAMLVLLAGLNLNSFNLLADTHTWSGAENGLWSQPGNWSVGGPPASGETPPVVLNFPSNVARREVTNNLPGLAIDFFNVTGSDYRFIGVGGGTNLYLTSHRPDPQHSHFYNLNVTGTNTLFTSFNTYGSQLRLNLLFTNQISISVASGASLNLACVLDGPGGWSYMGPGPLRIGSSVDNRCAGPCEVLSGTLSLDSGTWTHPKVSVGGPLRIGTTNMANRAVVQTELNDQFLSQIPLTILPSGTLNLYGVNAAVSSLAMTGGRLNLGTHIDYDWWGNPYPHYSTFVVAGNITTRAMPYSTPLIDEPGSGISYGGLSLTAPTNSYESVVDVADGRLVINADIEGAANLVKTGPGTLVVSGNDRYWGTVVKEGVVEARGGVPLSGSTIVSNGAQIIIAAAITNTGLMYLSGFGTNNTSGALVVDHNGAQFSGGLLTDTDAAIVISNPGHKFIVEEWPMTISSVGFGTLRKRGPGALQLVGNNVTNFFAGTFSVEEGMLLLQGTNNSRLITGPLAIGGNRFNVPAAQVRLLAHSQFDVSEPVTVKHSGVLDLNGYNSSIGPLILEGGNITTGVGQLALASNLIATNWYLGPSTINGILHLGAGRFIDVAPQAGVSIDATISDYTQLQGGFTKRGGGDLFLNANNPFWGPVTIAEGTVHVGNSNALGSALSGTEVKAGGALVLGPDVRVQTESLGLSGSGLGFGALIANRTNAWRGGIVLNGDAMVNVATNAQLELGGVIASTGGITKTGPGVLILNGTLPNSFTGTTVVRQGALILSKTNALAVPGSLVVGDDIGQPESQIVRALYPAQVGTNTSVTIHYSGLLDLTSSFNASQPVRSLEGRGRVSLGLNNSLRINNASDTVFQGKFTGFGPSSIVKHGSGQWTLTGGSDQFFGKTIVDRGTLKLNNWLPASPITVNPGGELTGDGVSGNILSLGGVFSPGCCSGLMRFSSKNLSLDAASIFRVRLDGTNINAANTSFSQASVLGSVSLGGATLNATLRVNSKVGDRFVIIDNDGTDPIVGAFQGLTEGATLVIGGASFRITYHGGDGNDVDLTQLTAPSPPQIGTITKLGDGTIQLTGTGLPNVQYTIEANSDLNTPNWIAIVTVAASPSGELTFVDANAPNHTTRFYRFVAH